MTENGNAPLLLSVVQAAKVLGISKNLCYDQINEGRIPHVRLGRRVLVSRIALTDWIARESGVGDTDPVVLPSRPQR